MASIRRLGVVTGGVAAGVVLAVSGVVLGWILGLAGAGSGLVEGNSPGLAIPLLLRLATGFVVVWIYVGFRPRFGAGRRAVVGAALATWAATALTLVTAATLFPILPPLTTALVVVWSVIELTVATWTGAAVYRRHAASSARKRGRTIDDMVGPELQS